MVRYAVAVAAGSTAWPALFDGAAQVMLPGSPELGGLTASVVVVVETIDDNGLLVVGQAPGGTAGLQLDLG